jgi:hypothetical protein
MRNSVAKMLQSEHKQAQCEAQGVILPFVRYTKLLPCCKLVQCFVIDETK